MAPEDTRLTDEQIELAVTFWTDQLKSKKFDAGEDAAASEEGREVIELLEAEAASSRVEFTEDQKARFALALKRILQDLPPQFVIAGFGVDYDPDPPLADALREAGDDADCLSLPWKTSMSFNGGGVSVYAGGKTTVLLPSQAA